MLHPDSGFFLIFQVNTRERYREGGNISLKKIPPPGGEGETKKKPKRDGKAAACFPSACLPDARRFWATFPGHGCEQGVCHKDSSSSCVRNMSNPITHITRILLATERSRRRKKREKKKLAPYTIYSLRHS
jgi:hypothetical protein